MADSVDFKEYEDLVTGSGGYRDIEVEMLKETLSSWKKNPDNPYTIMEVRDGRLLAAIAVASRIPSREYTFEIRYLCVDQDYTSTKVGERILQMIDEEFLLRHPQALIQYETSTRKLASVGISLLEASGYNLIGHIPDFYSRGDDFYMFSKFLSRVKIEPEKKAETEKAAPRAPATVQSAPMVEPPDQECDPAQDV